MSTIAPLKPEGRSQASLTPAQVEQFHRDGYLGPFAIASPGEVEMLRGQVEAVLARKPVDEATAANAHFLQGNHNRHLDSRVIFDLVTHPAIVQRMVRIMGPDLLLWRTNFFIKGASTSLVTNDKEIPWHQDCNYWPIEPEVVVSAWLALDEVTVENSCVQIIPGSHRHILPTIPCGPEMAFVKMADPKLVDASRAVNMELRPGEFFLFNERTLHHSEPNRSGKRRMGVAVRVIPPIVRVLEADSVHHKMILIHGQDRLGFNPLMPPPRA